MKGNNDKETRGGRWAGEGGANGVVCVGLLKGKVNERLHKKKMEEDDGERNLTL